MSSTPNEVLYDKLVWKAVVAHHHSAVLVGRRLSHRKTIVLVLTNADCNHYRADGFDISIPDKTASAALREHVELIVVQRRQTYCSV